MADEMPTENEFGNPAHVESGLRVAREIKQAARV